MILGKNCSRNCGFCNVASAAPEAVDIGEPARIAKGAKALGLLYLVITSVTRDDLADGGASHFAATVREVKKENSGIKVETLIPDFKGSRFALETVMASDPDVISHNMETVARLYPAARPEADYARSLALLRNIKGGKATGIKSKSGVMVGLGESREELVELFSDLRENGCDILTIGQYLAPSKEHLRVAEYLPPEYFDELKTIALDMGFEFVASAPFVRSSYNAAEAVMGEGVAAARERQSEGAR
jgi:lipoic acid synthetase